VQLQIEVSCLYILLLAVNGIYEVHAGSVIGAPKAVTSVPLVHLRLCACSPHSRVFPNMLKPLLSHAGDYGMLEGCCSLGAQHVLAALMQSGIYVTNSFTAWSWVPAASTGEGLQCTCAHWLSPSPVICFNACVSWHAG